MALTIGLVALLAVGVWVSQQFPALTNGPKSSAEVLEGLFRTSAQTVAQPRAYILEYVDQAAVR